MIQIPVLYSKIHRATVTDAQLAYQGSITIDAHLLELAGLHAFQQVQVYNITNGNRFETYVIEGPAHSGVIQINGAAAHLANRNDLVIIAAYANIPQEMAANWQPKLVYVNPQNQPKPAPDPSALLAVAY
ncbi:MAG: aspartate 1-decarboxylase [Candidatus Melainabacteria bacterium]|nr:aspartate 1-decarboxylase [Candidatus Melainabacteria bacterium]